ncbi:MAG: sulfotransferase [Candidatus Hodarchaeota archaeon]
MNQVSKRIKPNYLVIGAGKSGTTSLCELLDQHPRVFMSNPKELRFFSHDKNFQRGWDWYESFFLGAERALAIGEGSVDYTNRNAFPKTAERIAKSIPKAKLIYIVRHPLERIKSKWRMEACLNPGFPEFNQAVRSEFSPPDTDLSKYWFQISVYRDYFPDDQILVLFFEDFKSDPEGEIRRCFKFLGVDTEVELFEPDRPRNTMAYQRAYGYPLYFLRHLPISNLILDIMPNSWRTRIRNSPLLTRDVVSIPEWDLDTRKWVFDQLAEDIRMFLKFYGKPYDYWSF